MRKKSWLLALMFGALTVSVAACGDDSRDSEKDKPNPNTNHVYNMTCSNTGCSVTLYALEDKSQCSAERLCSATIGIRLTDDAVVESPVAVEGVQVTVTQAGEAFSVTQANNNGALMSGAQILTDNNGDIKLNVAAVAKGNGTVTFTLPAEYGSKTTTYSINVLEPEVLNTYSITANATYNGTSEFDVGFGVIIPDKTCDDLMLGEYDDVTNIVVSNTINRNKPASMSFSNHKGTIEFTDLADDGKNYAVVVSSNDYNSWGCADSLNKANSTAEIEMQDVDAHITPPDPSDYPPTYNGIYDLTSSFNALSLLPHAPVPAGAGADYVVPFANMLAGDWVEFALDLIANPEHALSNILVKQLLPMLISSNMLQSLLAKLNINLSSADIEQLINSFNLDNALENMLKGWTANLGDWFNTAKGIGRIVNDFATNFTLHGQFTINDIELGSDNALTGNPPYYNLHTYSSLLLNVGSYQDQICIANIGSVYGKTYDNSGSICKIDLVKLQSGNGNNYNLNSDGALEGKIEKILIDEASGIATIEPHPVNIAYGKLILGVLIKAVDNMLFNGKPNQPETIGQILEYYVGRAAAAYWDHHVDVDHANNPESTLQKLQGDEKDQGCTTIAHVLGLAIPAVSNFQNTIVSFCQQGVTKLDEFINNKLDDLASINNALYFSSDHCQIYYYYGPKTTNLSSFGYVTDTYNWWGSSSSIRCNWDLKIGQNAQCVSSGDEQDKNCVKGKFFAIKQ